MSARSLSITLLFGHLTTTGHKLNRECPANGNTHSIRLELLNFTSLKLCRLQFDLVWTYKIIYGHVNRRSRISFELRSTQTTRGHPYTLFKRQCACTRQVLLLYGTGRYYRRTFEADILLLNICMGFQDLLS